MYITIPPLLPTVKPKKAYVASKVLIGGASTASQVMTIEICDIHTVYAYMQVTSSCVADVSDT